MIIVKAKGELKNTLKFVRKLSGNWYQNIIEHYGKRGVNALSSATPRDTGKTASSWSYEVYTEENRFVLSWTNSNVNKGVPIAIVIQYGHGTPTGGWVEGRDYINPALQPIFDDMAKSLWKEVTSA